MIKKIIKKCFPFIFNLRIKYIDRKKNLREYKHFVENNTDSSIAANNIGYKIIILQHSLEKAMTSKKPRCFGVEKVKELIKYLNIYEEKNYSKDFSYEIGISILNEYCSFYEKNNWTDKDEYSFVKSFIKGKKTNVKTGVQTISKNEIYKNSKIDYSSFLSCRHAIRVFDKKKVCDDIIRKAVTISQLTPTACNRQMVKIYSVQNDELKNKIIKYIHGLSNFDTDTMSYTLLTYDISALSKSEYNQGMFNAGLVAMNFVNALHSFGIGSCFLEFNNDMDDEIVIKKMIGIPKNEKIAVSIAIGYYPDLSVVPCSTRKNIDDIYKNIK